DLHRTDLAAGAAQAACLGKLAGAFEPQQPRVQDGADRPRVDPAVGVTPDLAVDRAGVQAGTATDAPERVAQLRVRQHRAPTVVDQHHVHLFGSFGFALAARALEDRHVAAGALTGGAAR